MLDFEETVRSNYRKIYLFALHLTRNASDAEDLTQHTFYRLALNLKQVKNTQKAKSWLYSTLYRKFVDQRRRIVRFPSVEFEEHYSPPAQDENARGTRLDHEVVRRELLNLDESYRAVLSLFYLEYLSYKEIAATLELPVGTVMSRLYRGKEELHNRLTQTLRQSRSGMK